MLTTEDINTIKAAVARTAGIDARAALARCLADPTSLKILYVLTRKNNVCPSDLAAILSLSLSTVSHQLSKLKQMGVVSTIRHGHMICYSLEPTEKSDLIRKLVTMIMDGKLNGGVV